MCISFIKLILTKLLVFLGWFRGKKRLSGWNCVSWVETESSHQTISRSLSTTVQTSTSCSRRNDSSARRRNRVEKCSRTALTEAVAWRTLDELVNGLLTHKWLWIYSMAAQLGKNRAIHTRVKLLWSIYCSQVCVRRLGLSIYCYQNKCAAAWPWSCAAKKREAWRECVKFPAGSPAVWLFTPRWLSSLERNWPSGHLCLVNSSTKVFSVATGEVNPADLVRTQLSAVSQRNVILIIETDSSKSFWRLHFTLNRTHQMTIPPTIDNFSRHKVVSAMQSNWYKVTANTCFKTGFKHTRSSPRYMTVIRSYILSGQASHMRRKKDTSS